MENLITTSISTSSSSSNTLINTQTTPSASSLNINESANLNVNVNRRPETNFYPDTNGLLIKNKNNVNVNSLANSNSNSSNLNGVEGMLGGLGRFGGGGRGKEGSADSSRTGSPLSSLPLSLNQQQMMSRNITSVPFPSSSSVPLSSSSSSAVIPPQIPASQLPPLSSSNISSSKGMNLNPSMNQNANPNLNKQFANLNLLPNSGGNNLNVNTNMNVTPLASPSSASLHKFAASAGATSTPIMDNNSLTSSAVTVTSSSAVSKNSGFTHSSQSQFTAINSLTSSVGGTASTPSLPIFSSRTGEGERREQGTIQRQIQANNQQSVIMGQGGQGQGQRQGQEISNSNNLNNQELRSQQQNLVPTNANTNTNTNVNTNTNTNSAFTSLSSSSSSPSGIHQNLQSQQLQRERQQQQQQQQQHEILQGINLPSSQQQQQQQVQQQEKQIQGSMMTMMNNRPLQSPIPNSSSASGSGLTLLNSAINSNVPIMSSTDSRLTHPHSHSQQIPQQQQQFQQQQLQQQQQQQMLNLNYPAGINQQQQSRVPLLSSNKEANALSQQKQGQRQGFSSSAPQQLQTTQFPTYTSSSTSSSTVTPLQQQQQLQQLQQLQQNAVLNSSPNLMGSINQFGVACSQNVVKSQQQQLQQQTNVNQPMSERQRSHQSSSSSSSMPPSFNSPAAVVVPARGNVGVGGGGGVIRQQEASSLGNLQRQNYSAQLQQQQQQNQGGAGFQHQQQQPQQQQFNNVLHKNQMQYPVHPPPVSSSTSSTSSFMGMNNQQSQQQQFNINNQNQMMNSMMNRGGSSVLPPPPPSLNSASSMPPSTMNAMSVAPPPPPSSYQSPQYQNQNYQRSGGSAGVGSGIGTNQYNNVNMQNMYNYNNTNVQQQQYQQPGVIQSGFNRLWGNESIDLLQAPNILPPIRVEPPKINLGQEGLNEANCSPEIFRCTLTKMPESSSLLQKSRLPLGILIHPFKDINQLAVIQSTSIVRCRACRTYINPFVFFIDNKRWKCNLCYRVNDLPEDFLFDPVSKTYGDPSRRPEIQNSTMEYIASAEYMLRPPQPAVYLFLFDVSRSAVESGYLKTACSILWEEIEAGTLPGDSRTQVGFITYNSSLHYFNLGEGLSQPHELTVLDINDVFLPCPDNLLVNLKDRKELIGDLLKQLPERYSNSFDGNSAFGAALQAAHKLIGSTGGRVTCFQCSLPNIGPGSLSPPREDPSLRNTTSNIEHLNPANDFYKRLALDFSGQQIAIDLFILNSMFVDVATISGISRFSGGCIHHVPLFNDKKGLLRGVFERSFKRYLTRKIGFEAVMRIRCTRGLAIHTFHGNFFVRSTDLLSLPNINPDAGFGMQVSIEESLADLQTVCFQAALLYTSSKGERRIRVHTLCLPVTNSLTDLIHSADQQCIIGLLSKMAVDRSMQSNLSDAREAFINVAIDILSSYKLAVNSSNSPNSLLVPSCLKLLPLYISALLKNTAFRIGINTRLDDRIKAMCDMKSKPLYLLLQMIYPDLYPIHNLEEHPVVLNEEEEPIHFPPLLQLSARSLDKNGAYLLDKGEHMILLICSQINQAFINHVLGFTSFQSMPDLICELPYLEQSPKNLKLNAFVSYLNEEKAFPASLLIVKEDSLERHLFYECLIEDRVENALSYHEFLQHLKTQVK